MSQIIVIRLFCFDASSLQQPTGTERPDYDDMVKCETQMPLCHWHVLILFRFRCSFLVMATSRIYASIWQSVFHRHEHLIDRKETANNLHPSRPLVQGPSDERLDSTQEADDGYQHCYPTLWEHDTEVSQSQSRVFRTVSKQTRNYASVLSEIENNKWGKVH